MNGRPGVSPRCLRAFIFLFSFESIHTFESQMSKRGEKTNLTKDVWRFCRMHVDCWSDKMSIFMFSLVKQQVGVCGVSRCRETDSSGFIHGNIEYLQPYSFKKSLLCCSSDSDEDGADISSQCFLWNYSDSLVQSWNFFSDFIVQLRYLSSGLKPRPSVWESSDKKTLHAELQRDFQEVVWLEMKAGPRWEAAELLPVSLLAPSLWRLQAVRTPRIFSSDYNRVYLPSGQLIHLPASLLRPLHPLRLCGPQHKQPRWDRDERGEGRAQTLMMMMMMMMVMMMVKRGGRGDTPDHPGGFWYLMQYQRLAGFCSPQATDQ